MQRATAYKRVDAEDISVGDHVSPRQDGVFREVLAMSITANIRLVYADGEDIIPRNALWWRATP